MLSNRAAVLLLLGLSSPGCVTGGAGTPCVDDTDCGAGSRCNSARATPECQTLYTGETGASCSAPYFCTSHRCEQSVCVAENAPARLGDVVPARINLINLVDGGVGRTVVFSDDARNDCASLDTGTEYGHLALLSFHTGATAFVAGQTFSLASDAQARAGQVTVPYASFTGDPLSGRRLDTATGTVTVLDAPATGADALRFTLSAPDAGVLGTFTAPPLCP